MPKYCFLKPPRGSTHLPPASFWGPPWGCFSAAKVHGAPLKSLCGVSVETSSAQCGQSPAPVPKRCHKGSLKATFSDHIHLGSLGLTWNHLESPGLTWIQLHSLGLTWTYLDSLGRTWTHLDSLGFTRTHTRWVKREKPSGRKGKGKWRTWRSRCISTWHRLRAHARTTRNDFPVTGGPA